MYTVGLTGGIGSGKTLVSTLFEAQGICIIDTDKIARSLVASKTPYLFEIATHFGDTILMPDGSLNRRLLRDMIFKDPTEKKWLEQLLHPAIRAQVRKDMKHCQSPYSIIVIPLLAETEGTGYDFLDRILVVDCPEALQLQRTLLRDQIDEEQVLSMMRTQAARDIRRQMADDIIDNTLDEAHLVKQVNDLHKKYLELSLRKP